ncbi:copper resistance protein NlpE [Flavobacterium oreochromis]|uniref:Copper resistance protein NlpE n=2 Tax=Flavobacterium TaxID=237 RepID=A0A246GB88_9FLAO|nr:copper resistance protein NlpE [Flavobacterium oreochromis]OWP74491.1 hypothetical protein BWG23_13765 [Flavobacterium oreochromis]OWP77799.1 hypothetical protein BWK62_06465 [Flavobacterium oreochromis]POR28887.1 hypothetical protein BWK58_02965 [Flavobacterium columnare]
MKKGLFVFSVLLTLASCNDKKKDQNSENSQENNFLGVYKGTLPCADCSGIEVELVLNSNKTFLYNNLYLSQDNHAYKDKGTYTINNDTLILQKGKEQTHFLIGQDKLTLLDLNKKLIKGNFASYYILNKQKKYDYAGRYDIFYNSNENYKQTVSISPEKNQYKLVFSASKIKNKENCSFTGYGEVKNDTLWVNISNDSKQKVWMYVVPSHDNLGIEVFTPKYEDRFKMMYYCGGGGSLAGKYFKSIIKAGSIGDLNASTSIEDVLKLIPSAQITKKKGEGEFVDEVYDDYEIETQNKEKLFTITPPLNNGNLKEKINRVLIESPIFKTDKGINKQSTFEDLKKAYKISRIEPIEDGIVVHVDEIKASFSISKKSLKTGWWNEKTKTVDETKIALDSHFENFILWWN